MKITIDEELKMLRQIEDMKKAIDDEVDWYIAYLEEKDPSKKKFYFSMFESKQQKRIELAKEYSNEHE